MGKSAPSAPDPAATAAAQGVANKETAIAQAGLNMTNQITPSGNLSYEQIGTWSDGTPRYQATTSYSPEQQAIYSGANQIAGNQLGAINSALSKPLDLSSLGSAPQYDDAYRQQVSDAMLARQQPNIDRDEEALRTRLANQGITYGSQAFNDAQLSQGQRLNDLRLGIDATAGNEASRAYQNALTGRQQGISEMTLQRSQPINELTALLGLGQVQNPQFQGVPQTGVANTDVTGPAYQSYQGALNQYNQGQQSTRSALGGLAGLGGAAIMASDVRLKKNIVKIGTRDDGLNVYRYNYLWDEQEHIGVMAHEVEEIYPSAVIEVAGYKRVDYAQIGFNG